MSPKPSRAVMEARAPGVVESDDDQTALYRALPEGPGQPLANASAARKAGRA